MIRTDKVEFAGKGRGRRRSGLTMVELIVVVLIIAVLIALLIPAILGAVQKAREGAVVAEMNQMSQALASFRAKFGDYPPSRIMLDETGFYYAYSGNTTPLFGNVYGAAPATTDLTVGELSNRSLGYLQKFWPRMTYLGSGIPANVMNNGQWYDFNGDGLLGCRGTDGNVHNPYILQGYDCLTFFLGGVPNVTPDATGTPRASMQGWGKNPANPFPPQPYANATSAANRDPAFFEFKAERLIDTDSNGIPGYLDSLDSPSAATYYVYFSAYGNNGYDPNDTNVPAGSPDAVEQDNSNYAGQLIYSNFACTFGLTNNSNPYPSLITSPAPNPYTTAPPVPLVGAGVTSFVNPNTFQIISAGRDKLYGIGGQFANQSATGPRLPLDIGQFTPADPSLRQREADNLANFATGRLQ